jgi:glycosyltransferase involved in cell wall biosynthesis
MRICLICVEIFAWNKYGGFGRATRTIGRELNKRGLEVFAVVPRRPGQAAVENLDGITVYGFDPSNPFTALRLFRQINAEIYHSQEPSFCTYLAQRAMPHKKHVVTCRDTRDFSDWQMEFKEHSLSKLQVAANFIFEDNWLVRAAVRQADMVCTASRFLIPKARRKYRLRQDPVFLPTPVEVPGTARKSDTPVVTYVARLDRRKRPEIFCRLAADFPDVTFIAVGKSRDPDYDRYIRRKYGALDNLKMVGFIDQFRGDRLARIHAQSWVLVNTASREGLPNAFIEAGANKCAILSHVDPDDFARRFGYWARDDDFRQGLAALLENHTWRRLGNKAHAYVARTFETQRAIDSHLRLYASVTDTHNRNGGLA